MSENAESLRTDAVNRAKWVRDWWFTNRWLGVRGHVPEVRNLCDDVDALAARLAEAEAALLDLAGAVDAACDFDAFAPVRQPMPDHVRSVLELSLQRTRAYFAGKGGEAA